MAGSTHGVQAVIKDIYPSAEYIHCYAHQVNLIMIKAASINGKNVYFFLVYKAYALFFK